MIVHTIRLAGPWERELGDEKPRQQLPCEVFPGTLLSRAFHQPTGLDPGHRLQIRLTLATSDVEISLNDQPLDSHVVEESDDKCVITLDVTTALQKFNRLALFCGANRNMLHSAILEICADESAQTTDD